MGVIASSHSEFRRAARLIRFVDVRLAETFPASLTALRWCSDEVSLMDTQLREPEAQTFVETALKLGGKSEEEARTTGTIDRADDQVEALFAARYQTVNSPIHRAVWDHHVPVDLFSPQPPQPSPAVRANDARVAGGRTSPSRRWHPASAPTGK